MEKSEDKIVFITGATSGIGLITACELAAKGNTVIATARSTAKGNILIQHFIKMFPDKTGNIDIVICDLTSFESIAEACNTVKEKYTRIDTLINNAGVWNFAFKESKDKIEEVFQVNVLAPLLINHYLFSLLKKSGEAKSIFAASALHQGNVDFENLEFKNDYSGFKAYRQSKLEVILMCRFLAKKLEKSAIGVYCEHPGFVSTNLGKNSSWFPRMFFKLFGMRPEKGAETLLYLAEEKKSNLVSGEYYCLKKVKKITKQSYDMEVAKKLLDKIKNYITPYITVPSPIFENS
jgi:NAD(P)-dependent dehydrogenase (short-subunit alcohol dehydrogenase family)